MNVMWFSCVMSGIAFINHFEKKGGIRMQDLLQQAGSYTKSRAIAAYSEQVAGIDDNQYDAIWAAAEAYNESLVENPASFAMTEEEQEAYEQLLDVVNGVMGYIKIPSIDVTLPIYHGTDEAVLQVAVGHLEWSSLPVGGESSHCVISGHRGLPSAKLFTDLDKLYEGDTFSLYILDEVLTYEVDQIRIVEPQELEELTIEAGQDLCTLVTCTPYGVNSHRLLVRGHRVETPEEEAGVRVTADAMQVESLLVAPFVAAPILLLLLVLVLLPRKSKK